MIVDRQGNVLSSNKSLCDLLGYSEDELKGKHVGTILQEESAFDRKVLDDILEGREIQSEEVIYLSKGGRSVQVLYSAAALKNDDAFEGIIFLAKDITRYKQAKVKTEELEEIFDSKKMRY